MKSGGGVLCISSLQLVVGLCLLGIYEGYKVRFLNPSAEDEEDRVEGNMDTPLDWLFYLSIFNNIFSVFGLAGVMNSLKELVMAFFAFNAIQMVVAFHYFIDVWNDSRVSRWSRDQLGSLERAAIAFMFFNFLLSLCATFFAVKAIEEIKVKQRDEYNRLSVISDTLQYEPDNGRL
ncbi:hypothetical protein BSKO_11793 [Bryopsis sp. KO-2023]|nr:hypothetical protein BSKO_11793 [Bryopsis sp. KO-2023]